MTFKDTLKTFDDFKNNQRKVYEVMSFNIMYILKHPLKTSIKRTQV